MTRPAALAGLFLAVVAAGVAAFLLGRDRADTPLPGEPAAEGAGADAPPPGTRPGVAPKRPRGRAGRPHDEDPPPAAQGSVTGVVVREDTGAAVAGATVRWWEVPAPVRSIEDSARATVAGDALDVPPRGSARTDAAGRFALDVPPSARWQVVVVAEGYGPAADHGTGARDVRIALAPRAVLRWIVVEAATDRPVAGAVARAFDREFNGVPLGTFVCDSAGRGEADLSGGTDLLFSADGLASRWERLPSDPGEVHRVALSPAAGIAGRVVDAAGRPVPAARVACGSFAEGEGWPLALPVGPDGRFRFAVPADGETRGLAAEAEGFAPARTEAAPGESEVRIVLYPAAWIEGVAVDGRGVPVEEIAAEVDGVQGLVTGRGTFEIGPLPPGVHEVEIESGREGDKAWGATVVALRAGERRTGVRVVLQEPPPPTATRVRVTDPAGTPVRGVLVCWRDREWTQQRTDEAGRTTIRAPGPPGRAGALVTNPADVPGWAPGPPVETTARAGDDDTVVDLTVLPARPVAVRVLGSDGGDVVRDVRLGVRPAVGARFDGRRLWVAAGSRFVLEVQVAGRAPCEIPSSEGDVVDGVLEVRLPRGPVVRGRVAVSGDAPPMRLRVVGTVLRGSRERISASADAADADGSFALAGLPAGEGTLDVRVSDDLLARMPFTMGREDVDLGVVRIGPFVRLTGTAVDGRGVPVPRAGVRARGEGFSCGAETDAAGRFEVLVPEGAHVRLGASREDDLSAPVELAAARGAGPVTLRLERTARVLVFASFAEESGVSVRLRPVGGGPELNGGRSTWGALPPAFAIRVPPGAWDLLVRYDGREWTRPLTVGPGDVAELTLDE